jgi:hypothetical protein
MTEDASITNRRLKVFLIWLASCFALVVFQPLFKWNMALIQFYLEKTTVATLVIIGGLSATDAVNSYAATKTNGVAK